MGDASLSVVTQGTGLAACLFGIVAVAAARRSQQGTRAVKVARAVKGTDEPLNPSDIRRLNLYQDRGDPVWTGPVMGASFENELGATLPFKYWDPLGMAADGDEATFRRRRIAEIKNGRVAMIACIGYIVPEYFRWPGLCSPSLDLKFTDIPNGVGALTKLPAEGWAQMGVFIAFCDLFPLRQWEDRAPGDTTFCGKLGVPFTSKVSDPVGNKKSLDAEINNGRLAMLAITGMVAQNGLVGGTGPGMWFPTGAFKEA